MGVTAGFGVLGPLIATTDAGAAVDLRGPRQRAVLARLLVDHGRTVSTDALVDALWPDDPPPRAIGSIRTFVGDLRRALEPDRSPREPPAVLVTHGRGYVLHAASIDADRFEDLVDDGSEAALTEALALWRGDAYADVAGEPWARAEASRLSDLRVLARERLGQARVAAGRAAEAVADLDALVGEHPWRENAWRLLALALWRDARQGDALVVLRRARTVLADDLGLDPGSALRELERDILDGSASPIPALPAGSRAQLESTVSVLGIVAVTGGDGLRAARDRRLATVRAAERQDDAEVAARVIAGFDVPGVWTRSDDPEQAAAIVAAAERTLARLPRDALALRARLLATVAVECRGVPGARGPEAAAQATALARDLDDPRVTAFALDGLALQSATRAGDAADRDRIGSELVELSARVDLPNAAVLGRLLRMQALGALGDLAGAAEHADAADALADRLERPLATVFTGLFRAMVVAAGPADAATVDSAYRRACARLDGAGMPGVEHGLLPLALICARVHRSEPTDLPGGVPADLGPHAPWAAPLLLLSRGRDAAARRALAATPAPPPGLLLEASWCLTAQAALQLGDRDRMAAARDALAPAAGEIAGAGSGVVWLGPVDDWLARLGAALAD